MKFTADVTTSVEFEADTIEQAVSLLNEYCYPESRPEYNLNATGSGWEHLNMEPYEFATVRDILKVFGRLKTYDTALPQTWFDDFYTATGESPFGKFVWCYDPVEGMTPNHSGFPFPLSMEAVLLLDKHNLSKSVESKQFYRSYRKHPDWAAWAGRR